VFPFVPSPHLSMASSTASLTTSSVFHPPLTPSSLILTVSIILSDTAGLTLFFIRVEENLVRKGVRSEEVRVLLFRAEERALEKAFPNQLEEF